MAMWIQHVVVLAVVGGCIAALLRQAMGKRKGCGCGGKAKCGIQNPEVRGEVGVALRVRR